MGGFTLSTTVPIIDSSGRIEPSSLHIGDNGAILRLSSCIATRRSGALRDTSQTGDTGQHLEGTNFPKRSEFPTNYLHASYNYILREEIQSRVLRRVTYSSPKFARQRVGKNSHPSESYVKALLKEKLILIRQKTVGVKRTNAIGKRFAPFWIIC